VDLNNFSHMSTTTFPLQTIKQMHDEWAAMCIPTGAPAQQRQDMERAFYCGAISQLKGVTELTELTHEQSAETLNGWTAELTVYMKMLAEES
jgi:hypothetical protein